MIMRRPGPLALALLIWFVSEYMAFAYVVGKVGFFGALVLGIATSVLGVQALRRIGGAALNGLRRQVVTGEPSKGDLLDGSLAALGGVLLILPGFISDLIGFGLLSPSIRRWIAEKFSVETSRPPVYPRRANSEYIDLEATDWKRVEEKTPRKPRRPRSTANDPANGSAG